MRSNKIRRNILLAICGTIAILMCIAMVSVGEASESAISIKDEMLVASTTLTGAQNAVAGIYLNVRLWDTLFEALVLLVSATAVISFSRSDEHE